MWLKVLFITLDKIFEVKFLLKISPKLSHLENTAKTSVPRPNDGLCHIQSIKPVSYFLQNITGGLNLRELMLHLVVKEHAHDDVINVWNMIIRSTKLHYRKHLLCGKRSWIHTSFTIIPTSFFVHLKLCMQRMPIRPWLALQTRYQCQSLLKARGKSSGTDFSNFSSFRCSSQSWREFIFGVTRNELHLLSSSYVPELLKNRSTAKIKEVGILTIF